MTKPNIQTLRAPKPWIPIDTDPKPLKPRTEDEPDPNDVEPIEEVLLPVLKIPHVQLGSLGSSLPPRPLVQEKDHSPDDMTSSKFQTLPAPKPWIPIDTDATPLKPRAEDEPDPNDVEPIEEVLLPVLKPPTLQAGTLLCWLPPRPIVTEIDTAPNVMTALTIQTLQVPITWHEIEADDLPPIPETLEEPVPPKPTVLDPSDDRELTQPPITPPHPPHSPHSPHITTSWKAIGTDDELPRPEVPIKEPIPPSNSDDAEPIQLPINPPQPPYSPDSPYITTPWKAISADDELPRPEDPGKEPIPPTNSYDAEPIQIPIAPPQPAYSPDSPHITTPWNSIGADDELNRPEDPGKEPVPPPLSDDSEPIQLPITPTQQHPRSPVWIEVGTDDELPKPEDAGKQPGADSQPIQPPIAPPHSPHHTKPWIEIATDNEPSLPYVVETVSPTPVKPIIINDLEPNEPTIFVPKNVKPEPLIPMRSVKELSKPKRERLPKSRTLKAKREKTFSESPRKRKRDPNRKYMLDHRDNAFKYYDDFQW